MASIGDKYLFIQLEIKFLNSCEKFCLWVLMGAINVSVSVCQPITNSSISFIRKKDHCPAKSSHSRFPKMRLRQVYAHSTVGGLKIFLYKIWSIYIDVCSNWTIENIRIEVLCIGIEKFKFTIDKLLYRWTFLVIYWETDRKYSHWKVDTNINISMKKY